MGGVIRQALPRADEVSTLAVMHLMRDEGAAMLRRSPEDCGRFFANGTMDTAAGGAFGPGLVTRDMQVTAGMLKQSATAPHSWPGIGTALTADDLAVRAMKRIPAPDREKTARSLDGPSPTFTAQCAYALAVLDELLSEAPALAARDFHALRGTRDKGSG